MLACQQNRYEGVICGGHTIGQMISELLFAGVIDQL